ncbi:hypothetical protein KSP39_PZI011739 [Platanthera zijinensis]|uniref:Uncharacterized protein n=1 Tax=Platanthera zijinensis TaxID=2320716 RepID=A0AAP0BE69_9ASPA
MEWPPPTSSPPRPSSTVKQKIGSKSFFSCCFRGGKSAGEQEGPSAAAASSLIRSSSTWMRSKASELLLNPDLKERYRAMMARMQGKSSRRGGGGGYGHDQLFGYDPLSYALNFDEGAAGDDDDSAVDPHEDQEDYFRRQCYRNFSSRLPASPPQPSTGVPAVR